MAIAFTNGNLVTLDRGRPRATGMLVEGEKIVAVGDGVSGEGFVGRVIDLGGRTVVPGFIDSHIHLYWYGMQLLKQADLVGVGDVEEMLARLAELGGRSKGGWIQGHGFDQSKMKEGRFVTRGELDRVSRDRPIIVSRVCGHAAVVNSAALAIVSAEQRRSGDEENGLYTENAIGAFYAKIPPMTDEEGEEAVLAAARVALRTGITSVQTLLDAPEQMRAYARLRRKGILPIRVVGMPPYDAVERLHGLGVNATFGDEWVRFGAAKFFSDGSLGAWTALLSEPYADKPAESGIRIYEPGDLKRKCRDAQERGFQVAIHAIGDQALRESLDAIEYALNGEDNRLHRHRIEHASLAPSDCVERMARMKVVVTCQPQFVTSDTWTADRIGPRRTAWAYPFRTLLEAGVPISLSSDCPVEKLDAFECLWAAVGRHAWSPSEGLSPEEAIRAYCTGSAYAGHVERWVGSLEAGKMADFAVLSGDPTAMTAGEIKGLKAEQVWVGGRKVV